LPDEPPIRTDAIGWTARTGNGMDRDTLPTVGAAFIAGKGGASRPDASHRV
jgi:hypothetical protein